MSINLSISFSHPDAVAHRVRYARIDNTVNPNYITVSPDPITSPATIASNIPNGQYRIESYPIYADGRPCSGDPLIQDTAPCEPLVSINAYLSGDTIVVQYLAPPDVPKVRITINYPNGGSYTANYVNNGNDIPIAIPSNLEGDFLVFGQSVCDEGSGFFSPLSSQVTVTKGNSNLSIENFATGLTITSVSGIAGYSLPAFVEPGASASGSHQAFSGAISVYFSGTTLNQSAALKVNGTQIQCVNLVTGSPANFSSAFYSSTDVITIELNDAVC